MKILIILAVITSLLLWYALSGRDWLKSKSWANGFFELFEPIEILLFKKSETILVGRTLQGLGGILTFLTFVGSIDVTPILPLVPEKYQAMVNGIFSCLPLVLNGLGAIIEWLRNRTTKPLELVAITDKELAENPVMAQAVAVADAAKAEAVSVVVTEEKKAA